MPGLYWQGDEQAAMDAVHLGSVFRTVLLSLRTLLIWSANLAVFYSNDGGDVGEHWDRDASPVQCAGFVLLLLGTLLYAQGSSAVTRDTKSIVTDIQGIYRALSVRSSVDLPWPDLQLAQAASARGHSNQQGVTGSAVPVSPQWIPVSPAASVHPDRVPLLAGPESLASSARTTVIAPWQPLAQEDRPQELWVLPGRSSVDSATGSVRHRVSFADELRSVVDSGVFGSSWGTQDGRRSSLASVEYLSVGLPSFTDSGPGAHRHASGRERLCCWMVLNPL